MSQEFNVVVLGASGAVGQTMIEILEERNFPVANLFPLASSRSAGETVSFHGKQVEILDVESFDWTQAQIGFFSAGGDVSAKWAPIAADAGCVVIDNTSHYRYDLDIPLVIPEVNPQAIADFRNRNIIANPNCSTIQMLVALKLSMMPLGSAVSMWPRISRFPVQAKRRLKSWRVNLPSCCRVCLQSPRFTISR